MGGGGSQGKTRHLYDSALRVSDDGGVGGWVLPCSSLRSNTIENYCVRIIESIKEMMCATWIYLTNLTHSPLNRPCGSTSFLTLVTSSVLTVIGPFLESPGNFSGPKSNIQIEI